jgi:antitoxin (DNA-binding transcriptional repressor) of toxin-antitoxin stability system
MSTVTVHEAKTHLSRLIADALAGKEVVIARGKVPAVRLVPVEPIQKRVPGKYKGMIQIDDSFYEPMSEEELALWYGDGEN